MSIVTGGGGLKLNYISEFIFTSGSWVVPEGVGLIFVTMVGGAGGGGGGARGGSSQPFSSTVQGGGGGAAGYGRLQFPMKVFEGDTLPIVIGAPGPGGAGRVGSPGNGADGGRGGNTTFHYLEAVGGQGGKGGTLIEDPTAEGAPGGAANEPFTASFAGGREGYPSNPGPLLQGEQWGFTVLSGQGWDDTSRNVAYHGGGGGGSSIYGAGGPGGGSAQAAGFPGQNGTFTYFAAGGGGGGAGHNANGGAGGQGGGGFVLIEYYV